MASSASQPRSVTCACTVQSASQLALKAPRAPRVDPRPPTPGSAEEPVAPSPATWPSVLHAEGIGAEDEPVLMVVEGVENELDRVRLGEVGVALALRVGDAIGLAVEGDDADVEVLVVEGDPHLGFLRRRLALVGVLLHEVGVGLDPRPDVVVDAAVDRRGVAAQPGRGQGPRGRRGGRLGGRERGVEQGGGGGRRHDTAQARKRHGIHQISAIPAGKSSRVVTGPRPRLSPGRGNTNRMEVSGGPPAPSPLEAHFFCKAGCT